MTVQKPSLDEVFLALTGHDTGQDDAETADDATSTTRPDGGIAMTTTQLPVPVSPEIRSTSRRASAWPTRSRRR